jgi:hypothetical protein
MFVFMFNQKGCLLMKTLIINTVLLSGLLFAAQQANAAHLECQVANKPMRAGGCFAVGTAHSTNANFRIMGLAGSVSQVMWEDGTAGCNAGSTYCSKTIYQYSQIQGGAKVLYTDGSWEQVTPATARYEGLD